MNSLLGAAIVALGLISFALVFVYLFMTHKLFVALERKHHEVWVSIGSPHLIKNNSLVNNFSFLRYLLSGGFFKLGDEVLSRLARTVFYLFCCSLGAFLLWFATYFLGRSLV
ncbi:MAG TPA: hypothetical protein PL023_13665 [Thiobacillus sp.]|nr:hypothetical protein [Thiobacillus sp.]